MLVVNFLAGGQSRDFVELPCRDTNAYCAEVTLKNLVWNRVEDRYHASLSLRVTSKPRVGPEISDVRFRIQPEEDWFDYLRKIPQTQKDWEVEGLSELANPAEAATEKTRALYKDAIILRRKELPLMTSAIRHRRLFPLDAASLELAPEGCVADEARLEPFLCPSPEGISFSTASVGVQSTERGVIIECSSDQSNNVHCRIARSWFVVLAAAILLITPLVFFVGASASEPPQALLLRAAGFWASFTAARTFLPADELPFPTLLDLVTVVAFVTVFVIALTRGTSSSGKED